MVTRHASLPHYPGFIPLMHPYDLKPRSFYDSRHGQLKPRLTRLAPPLQPAFQAVIAEQNIAHAVAHCPFLLSGIHQHTFLLFVFASLHHLNSAARADWPPHYLSDWSNEPHFCRCQIPSLCRRFFLKVVIWARSVRSLLHYFQIFSLMAYNESIGVLVYYEGMAECLF